MTEEQRLKVFDMRVLQRIAGIFGPKREEVTGG
jgi:hypothetical protein